MPIESCGRLGRAADLAGADVEVEMDASNGRVHAYLAAHAEVYRQEYLDNRVRLRCYLPKHLVYHIQEPDVHIREVEDNGAAE